MFVRQCAIMNRCGRGGANDHSIKYAYGVHLALVSTIARQSLVMTAAREPRAGIGRAPLGRGD